MNDLEREIAELEAEWQIYHKDHKNNKMPDMERLAKLRAERDRRKRSANL